jgi:hypothetical protein
MLFWKRYRYNPEGLLELAGDLASPDLKRQGRAAKALRKDRMLRDEVRLVDAAMRITDEQRAAGQFEGDAAALDALRPIGGVIARLQELSSTPHEQVRRTVATALDLIRTEDPAIAETSSRRGLTRA